MFPWDENEGMEKVSFAEIGVSRGGDTGVSFLRPAGEKVASEDLISEAAQEFMCSIEPAENTRYLFVNAMGAHEYWGSNSRDDAWPEAGLCHLPAQWTGKPVFDRTLVQRTSWPYGLPTFYNGHTFPHHRNKDPKKKVGDIVYSGWNDHMKRVELVLSVERELLLRWDGPTFWDMIESGDFPAVSMGSKVPWDRCSNCTDMDEFFHAMSLFKPSEHAHPGIAVLQYHVRMLAERGRGIRGIARTPKEYCDCMRHRPGQILPSGIKVFVYNDFPRFFDQSLVKRGADKTAYTMVVINRGGRGNTFRKVASMEKTALTMVGDSLGDAMRKFAPPAKDLPSALRPGGGPTLAAGFAAMNAMPLMAEAKLASAVERLGAPRWTEVRLQDREDPLLQAVSAWEVQQEKIAEHKAAARVKGAEMVKEIDATVQEVAGREKDLPRDVLDTLSEAPLEKALGSLAHEGIVLRPREFLRICLCKRAPQHRDLADHLTLPLLGGDRPPPMTLSPIEGLMRLLSGYRSERSGFDEPLRERVVVIMAQPAKVAAARGNALVTEAVGSDFLRKIAGLYDSYREGLMAYLPQAVADAAENKVAGSEPEDLLTPLSYGYFQKAFQAERSR